MLAADDTLTLDMRLAPPVDRRQRNFWIALTIALVFHAALLFQANRNAEYVRTAGAESGADNAIAVDLVTEADLKSREIVALPPGAPPGGNPPVEPPVQKPAERPQEPPPTEAKQAPKPEARPTPEAEAQPTPEPTPPQPETQPKPAEPAAAEPQPAEPAAKAEAKPEPKEQAALIPPFETLTPEFESSPKPAEPKKSEPVAKPAEAEPAPKQPNAAPVEKQQQPKPPQVAAKKKQQQAKLDLSPPATAPSVSAVRPGRGFGGSRPPGITRSGANDDFGRGVIRALRQTMPPPNGRLGRVTIRILLNDNGDLAEVQVLAPSSVPGLDQSVVFSTKQAYFPLPPPGATTLDKTFLITYVYR